MMAQTPTLWITTQGMVVSGAAHTTESQYGSWSAEVATLALKSSSLMAIHHLIVLLGYLASPLWCLPELGPA